MRKHRTIAVLFLATTSWAAFACSSGSGPLAAFDDPYDRPPDSRDKPGEGRDKPALSGYDPPNGSLDNPGSQGGGPANGGNGGGTTKCPPCDATFRCTTTVGSQTVTSTVRLKTVNGQCDVVDSKGKSTGTLACGGQVTSSEGSGGTWASTGPDNLTASVPGDVNGQNVTLTLTCTRSTESNTPPSTGTGTATPTPTTVPTETPLPADAGTKG